MTETESPGRTAVIVEDDADVRSLLVDVFEGAGFSTVSATNGIDGVEAVLTHQPLVTTLDVTMPGIDGVEAARRIRAQSDTYIIMLTAMDDEADVVLGLTAGADEYITKPFRPRAFRARIDAMLRRVNAAPALEAGSPSTGPADGIDTAHPRDERQYVPRERTAVDDGKNLDEGNWLAHRNLKLDLDSRIVMIDHGEVELTRTEFDLLAALLESRRRVRSKADLTVVLRGASHSTSYFVGDADRRAIEAHMTNLRRKLGDSPAQPRFIETVRGVGYRLTAETTSPQV